MGRPVRCRPRRPRAPPRVPRSPRPRPDPPGSHPSSSASSASTANIAPSGGEVLHQPAPGGDQVQASSSDSTPVTWAAASSPTECPGTKSGVSPTDDSRRYSATWSANSAGWVNSVGPAVTRGHHRAQRPAKQRSTRAHQVQRVAEHRERGAELPPHPRPLGALTGEQEGRVRPPMGPGRSRRRTPAPRAPPTVQVPVTAPGREVGPVAPARIRGRGPTPG